MRPKNAFLFVKKMMLKHEYEMNLNLVTGGL